MTRSIHYPAFAARNLMVGTLFNIVFGTLWISNGLNALQRMQSPFLFSALAVVAITLLVACLHLLWSVRRFPLHMPVDEFQRKSRAGNLATAIEFVGSTILSILLVLADRSALVLPLIVGSVGLYLLALASILGLVHYYIAGALLCLLPIVIILLIPAVIPLDGAWAMPETGRLILIGLIGGGIQFGLASLNLGLTVALRRRLQAEEALEAAAHGEPAEHFARRRNREDEYQRTHC